jgi:hypothetical protein
LAGSNLTEEISIPTKKLKELIHHICIEKSMLSSTVPSFSVNTSDNDDETYEQGFLGGDVFLLDPVLCFAYIKALFEDPFFVRHCNQDL